MTLLTGADTSASLVSKEGGELSVGGGFAVLDPPIVLENVFCPACSPAFDGEQAETRFVIEFRFANGLFGCCTRCGDERVAAFTRTNSEAA